MLYLNNCMLVIMIDMLFHKSGGKNLSVGNITKTKNEIIELLKLELPVLRAKARISQEEIAKK